jgi:hypothetical protein
MRPIPSRPALSRIAKAALALEIFLAIGALAGGIALMVGPRGEIIPLKMSSLAGSPFDTFFVPGLILFSILGLGPLVAALLVWLRHPLAPLAAFVIGVGLLIWLAVEIAVIGYSNDPPLQPFYLILGSAITLVAVGWIVRERATLLQDAHIPQRHRA